jgi:hypothetical protein
MMQRTATVQWREMAYDSGNRPVLEQKRGTEGSNKLRSYFTLNLRRDGAVGCSGKRCSLTFVEGSIRGPFPKDLFIY